RVQARMPQPAATHSLEPQKAGAQSLPEAPASANVRLTVQGFDVQVTLRDFSEARLMIRLEELLQTYGKVQPHAPSSTPARPAARPGRRRPRWRPRRSSITPWRGAGRFPAGARCTIPR